MPRSSESPSASRTWLGDRVGAEAVGLAVQAATEAATRVRSTR
ncbi:MAG TPA: hypothetical protein VEX86_15715 [Longimicrobium sp.]|nr:hypothetical protein [Longimicrobium sp.]